MRREAARLGMRAVASACVVAACLPALTGCALSRSAGPFRWSSAIVATASSRTLSVSADVEGHDAEIGCDPLVQPHLTETSSSVTIEVEVVDRPLPPGVGCGASAVGSLPATVHLTAPLGDRALIDGTDGARHPVLVVDAQPTIRDVPTPFLRQRTSWTEADGQVHEWWRWQRRGQAAQITLDLGPPAALERFGTPPAGARSSTVGTRAATTWRSDGGDTVTSVVVWSTGAARELRLQVIDQSARPLSSAAVLELARAVR